METTRAVIEPKNTTGWDVGTRLFFVPIRYWEVQEPQTGTVVLNASLDGKTIYEDGKDQNFVYVFHDDCGHNVYMDRDMAFTTRESAIAFAEILISHDAMGDDIEMTALMKKIFAE